MKKVFTFKNTKYDSFSFIDLQDLFQPRITFNDINEIDILIRDSRFYNKKKVKSKSFRVSKEKSYELSEKRLELVHLLLNTPLNYYDFHVYLSKCKITNIFVYFPSSVFVQNNISRCHLHTYCPICNSYFLLSIFPKIHYQISLVNNSLNRKTILIYIKNLNLNFNAFWYGYLYIVFRLFSEKFKFKHYSFSIRPAFNNVLKSKESLFDILFVGLEPLDTSEFNLKWMYNVLTELFDIIGKKLKLTVQFDCEFYVVDLFEKEIFDYLSIVYYRIPIDIYFKQGVNPSYYQYLYSGYWINGPNFRSFFLCFGKKSFIEELYNDWIGKKHYKMFWYRLKKEFPQYFEFLQERNKKDE